MDTINSIFNKHPAILVKAIAHPSHRRMFAEKAKKNFTSGGKKAKGNRIQ